MYTVGAQIVGTVASESGEFIAPPLSQSVWTIEVWHKTGGFKKRYVIGNNSDIISEFKLSRNLKGGGIASLKFEKLDFPIDAEDRFKLYFQGNHIYTGIVDIIPDPKGGEVQIIPLWNLYKRYFFSGTYATVSILTVLEEIVTEFEEETGILWNPTAIEYAGAATIENQFVTERPDKIINDLLDIIGKEYYWGVSQDGFFYVKAFETAYSENLLYGPTPLYSELEVERDLAGIPATRYEVFRKSTNTALSIGRVGDGGSYPVIPLEAEVGRKDDKYYISDVLTDAEGRELAYAKLVAQVAPVTISMKNFLIEEKTINPGQRLRVQDREEKVLRTIIDCDSLTQATEADGAGAWTGATLDTTEKVEGTGSVYFDSDTSGDGMEFLFDHQRKYKNNTLLGFMIRSEISGQHITVKIYYGGTGGDGYIGSGTIGLGLVGIGETGIPDTTETIFTQTIDIPFSNVWNHIQFAFSGQIMKIRFELNSNQSSSIKTNVDRIQIFQNFREIYEANVYEMEYSVNPRNFPGIANVKLQSYNTNINDRLKALEDKVAALGGTLEA